MKGMSVYALQSAFNNAGKDITCHECIAKLQDRILEVVQKWAEVKVSSASVSMRLGC